MNAAKAGKKMIRLVNGMIDTAVTVVVLLLVVVGCYAVWDSKQVYEAADASRYEVYKPTDENEGASFSDLQAMNPDVFAWLTVYGTHIDYPVVQGENNMKYINTNAEGLYSLSGAIFLDYRSSKDFSDFSSILYGHHMDKSAMFGEVGSFAEKQFFETHKYGQLYYGGQTHGLEFFAFVHTSAYDDTIFRTNITGWEARQEYLDALKFAAKQIRDIQVTPNDRIVLLSTCSASTTNGRDILVARITDDIYKDEFQTEKTDNDKVKLTVDTLPGIWAQIPLWARISMICLLILLVLLLSLIINHKKHYRNQNRNQRFTQIHRRGDR